MYVYQIYCSLWQVTPSYPAFPRFFKDFSRVMCLTSLSFYRKKIEEIGKMTALSQEDIITNTKTVVQGLDTLRNEHNQILNSLLSSMKAIKEKNGETNLVEEKTNILKRSIDQIDLGLGEAQVGLAH